MRKSVFVSLLLLSIFFTCFTTAYAEEPSESLTLTMEIGNPMMTVNGTQKEIDPGQDTAPAIVNGRALVPISAIVGELGGSVTWEESTRTITLLCNDDEIVLALENTAAIFNDEPFTLDAAPTTINNRTMLPIRFIAERFQFEVDWNPGEQRITITNGSISGSAVATAASEAGQMEYDPRETGSARTLAVYFSATGNTKSLAEKIAGLSNADLHEIVPAAPYSGEDLNYNNDNSRANQEINADTRPQILPLSIDVAQYDVILIGYPIWWGQCPPAVRTFLETYDFSGKTIMPFCTSGSSGISGSLDKINQLCPGSIVTEGLRGASTTDTQIITWLVENGFQFQDSEE